jgi:hypothetical protein
MGRRIDWGGLQAFNICRVFLYMAEVEEGEGV